MLFLDGAEGMAELTFLVSFFNSARVLTQCIRSLKAQTAADFVCVIVDDGSTDGGREIAESEIAGDERFSLISHERNLGVGAGRATAIANTSTEFLTFVDADDELDADAAEKILRAINGQAADLYVFDYSIKNERDEVRRISGSARTAGELFCADDGRISRVWHKVFRTQLLQDIDLSFLRTVSFAEDLYLCTLAFMQSSRTVIVPESYYTYRYNGGSLVHSRTEKSIRENIAVLQRLLAEERLRQFPEIEAYIKDDSFHTFGQLIFPNKKNAFQWECPHFEDWRRIDADREVFIPAGAHPLVRLYVALIRARRDRAAKAVWHVLRLRERGKRTAGASGKLKGEAR